MDFLKNAALSQGIEHYHLLVFMATVCSVVFFPYILFVLGSSSVSLWFANRSKRTGDAQAHSIARTLVADAVPTKSSVVFLGMLPGLSLVLLYAQMLQGSPAISVGLAGTGFIFLVIGLTLLSNYRHLISLEGIFSAYNSLIGEEKKETLDTRIQQEREETLKPLLRSGTYGVIFVFTAILFYLSAWSLLRDPEGWSNVESIFDVAFTPAVWLKFIMFFAVCLGATGAGILYFTQLRTPASHSNEALQHIARRFTIIAFIVVPIFSYLSLATTPTPAISGATFFLSGISLLLFFLSANFLYQNFREKKFATVAFGALCFLLGTQFLVISDHVGIGTATRAHAQVLELADDKVFEELNKELGVAAPAMTGEEIYQAKCSACHLFDQKKVGPPYNVVLKKYMGQKSKMMTFVMSPVKVNPDYPAMPNQGLRPSEADSIVTYLLGKMEHPSEKK